MCGEGLLLWVPNATQASIHETRLTVSMETLAMVPWQIDPIMHVLRSYKMALENLVLQLGEVIVFCCAAFCVLLACCRAYA